MGIGSTWGEAAPRDNQMERERHTQTLRHVTPHSIKHKCAIGLLVSKLVCAKRELKQAKENAEMGTVEAPLPSCLPDGQNPVLWLNNFEQHAKLGINYTPTMHDGPLHRPSFRCRVIVGGVPFPEARGWSEKAARRLAAEEAVKVFYKCSEVSQVQHTHHTEYTHHSPNTDPHRSEPGPPLQKREHPQHCHRRTQNLTATHHSVALQLGAGLLAFPQTAWKLPPASSELHTLPLGDQGQETQSLFLGSWKRNRMSMCGTPVTSFPETNTMRIAMSQNTTV